MGMKSRIRQSVRAYLGGLDVPFNPSMLARGARGLGHRASYPTIRSVVGEMAHAGELVHNGGRAACSRWASPEVAARHAEFTMPGEVTHAARLVRGYTCRFLTADLACATGARDEQTAQAVLKACAERGVVAPVGHGWWMSKAVGARATCASTSATRRRASSPRARSSTRARALARATTTSSWPSWRASRARAQ
jgi:hypothetical protein